MTMQYDVLSSYNTTSPANITSNRQRLKGFMYLGNGTAGSIIYTDTNSGAILYKMIVSASDTYTINLVLPGEGILAAGGLTLTFTNCSYITTIYGQSRMAKSRREESERRLKRQGSGIRKEGGDEFKSSPTRGRITERLFLRQNDGDEEKTNDRKDGQRPKQSD